MIEFKPFIRPFDVKLLFILLSPDIDEVPLIPLERPFRAPLERPFKDVIPFMV